jgi:lambda family phage portal protein
MMKAISGRSCNEDHPTLRAGGGPRSAATAWATMASPICAQLAARAQLASRANYQAFNNPVATALVDTLVTSIVADGPSVRSAHPDKPVATALEQAWGRFWQRADAEGLADLLALINGAVRSMVTAGEALLLLVATPRGELRLRLITPEQLDPAMTRMVENMQGIIAGVEFSVDGRRIAYHIYPDNPDLAVNMLWTPVRVPADDVLHVFESRTPGQVRGTSWLAPVLTRLLQLDALTDAMAERAAVAALFGGFVTDTHGSGAGIADATQTDPRELGLEPGALRYLPPGTAITFPNLPDSGDAAALLKHLLHEIAAALGLSYAMLTGDYSDATYSSCKAGIEQHKRRVTAIRALLVARLIRPVWERFVTLEILSGRLHAPDFERDPTPYLAMTTTWPAFPSLDPYRESEAAALLLQNGIRSRAEIVASLGRDVSNVDAEIAADRFVPRVTARQPNSALLGGQNA